MLSNAAVSASLRKVASAWESLFLGPRSADDLGPRLCQPLGVEVSSLHPATPREAKPAAIAAHLRDRKAHGATEARSIRVAKVLTFGTQANARTHKSKSVNARFDRRRARRQQASDSSSPASAPGGWMVAGIAAIGSGEVPTPCDQTRTDQRQQCEGDRHYPRHDTMPRRRSS
jgi:hypothetical protein